MREDDGSFRAVNAGYLLIDTKRRFAHDCEPSFCFRKLSGTRKTTDQT